MSAGALAALALAGLGPADPPRAAPVQRPNILLIITDDQRDGTLGVMPHTRRLFGSGGRTFRNGYATTPLCCPSRASIYTGRYAHNHGVRNNGLASALDPQSLIQRHLQGAGYRTAIVGKYLHRVRTDPPHFDLWASWAAQKAHYDFPVNEQGTVRRVHAYSTTYVRRKARRFLRRFESEDSQPWFLVVAPKAPHAPFVPAPEHRDAPVPPWRANPSVRESDRTDKPDWVRAWDVPTDHVASVWARQLRMLRSVDGMVAAVFDKLRDLGENRRTLAFFISDNGYIHGEHRLSGKRFPYPASTDVPFMLRWPGHIAEGESYGRPAANVDIAPTIAQVAGVSLAADGYSLLGPHRRTQMFTEYFRDGHHPSVRSWAAIRTAGKHYVEHYSGGRVAFREFYALDRDPWELVNLFRDGNRANNPDVTELRRRLRSFRGCSGSTCP